MDRRTNAASGSAHRRRGNREHDQLARARERLRIGRDLDFDRDVDFGQVACVAPLPGELTRLVVVAGDEKHRAALGEVQGERRTPRAGPDHRALSVALRHQARPLGRLPGRALVDGARRVNRARGRRSCSSRARSRSTRRIGVPWKPNASRNRFSR